MRPSCTTSSITTRRFTWQTRRPQYSASIQSRAGRARRRRARAGRLLATTTSRCSCPISRARKDFAHEKDDQGAGRRDDRRGGRRRARRDARPARRHRRAGHPGPRALHRGGPDRRRAGRPWRRRRGRRLGRRAGRDGHPRVRSQALRRAREGRRRAAVGALLRRPTRQARQADPRAAPAPRTSRRPARRARTRRPRPAPPRGTEVLRPSGRPSSPGAASLWRHRALPIARPQARIDGCAHAPPLRAGPSTRAATAA